MNWSTVGQWIKQNAGTGAALVGSLLTGNVPGVVAAGVAMIGEATGSDDPDAALATLQNNPEALVRLREIANRKQEIINTHIETMHRLDLEDAQAEHHETQETVRAGDLSGSVFNRLTRPGQSWLFSIAAIAYVFAATFTGHAVDVFILGALLAQPMAYNGLRTYDKANVYKIGAQR